MQVTNINISTFRLFFQLHALPVAQPTSVMSTEGKNNSDYQQPQGSTGKTQPLASLIPRPFKVTECDTDRSVTYDFLLVIHSKHRPILYRF